MVAPIIKSQSSSNFNQSFISRTRKMIAIPAVVDKKLRLDAAFQWLKPGQKERLVDPGNLSRVDVGVLQKVLVVWVFVFQPNNL